MTDSQNREMLSDDEKELLRKYDPEIERYLLENPQLAETFVLDLDRFPPSLEKLASTLYPNNKWKEWATDEKNEKYRTSPLKYISPLVQNIFWQHLKNITLDLYFALPETISEDKIPSLTRVYFETRAAQYEQLFGKKEV